MLLHKKIATNNTILNFILFKYLFLFILKFLDKI